MLAQHYSWSAAVLPSCRVVGAVRRQAMALLSRQGTQHWDHSNTACGAGHGEGLNESRPCLLCSKPLSLQGSPCHGELQAPQPPQPPRLSDVDI